MRLSAADKPPMACLASRIPHGTRITRERLGAIDRIEETLRGLGFSRVRVRHHGAVARIEVAPGEIERLCGGEVRARVVKAGRAAGYAYVAADLEGYATGSLNRMLKRSTGDAREEAGLAVKPGKPGEEDEPEGRGEI
jgi:uncharacterized protein